MDVMELEQKVDNNCDGRRSTDDIGQFITLSVHLYAPEAARRAGPSASANTCIRPTLKYTGSSTSVQPALE